MKLLGYLSVVVAVTVIPAIAEAAWQDHVGISGHLDFGVQSRPSGPSFHEFADFTFRSGTGAIHTEIGWFGMVGRLHETYGALTYAPGDGRKLSVGFPRPAYDGFAMSHLIEAQPREGLDLIGISASRATFGVMTIDDFLPFGLRYDGRGGGLDYAVSLHGVTGAEDVILGFGAERGVGDWTLSGALEVVSLRGDVSGNAKIALERALGAVNVGAGYFHPAANGEVDHLEVFATARLSPKLEATGLTIVPLSGGGEPHVGATVVYDLGRGFDLRASAFDPGGSRESVGMGLRWSF